MSGPTPTPWIVVTTRNTYAEPSVFHWREIVREGDEGEDDTVIAEVYVAVNADQKHPGEDGAAANAALIVKAVNAYQPMLEALEICLAMAPAALKKSMNLKGQSPYDIGIAAIRLAKGEAR